MEASSDSIRLRLDHGADRSHDIVFDNIGRLPEMLSDRSIGSRTCVLITDSNVVRLHASRLQAALAQRGWDVRTVIVEAGEPSKSLPTYIQVIDEVLAAPIDRQTPVIALGGGVVGDLAGFVAASLLRGVPFIQVPTTVVAQVDSAIGGKVGINHRTGKNLIGAFHQPKLVAVDTDLLQTLPEAEWMDGLSEVVKSGLITDAAFTRNLLTHWDKVLARDRDFVRYMVRRCAEIKAEVVSEDETEQGRRAILNFGHTFGHALERVSGYQGVTHGQGVAVGMRAALHLSASRYPNADFVAADELVRRLPAPRTTASIDELIAAMSTDKKRVGNELRFVLLSDIGQAVVENGVGVSEIRASWKSALGLLRPLDGISE